jgi:hypothetical protein
MKSEPLCAKFYSIVAKCLRKGDARQILRIVNFTNRGPLSVPQPEATRSDGLQSAAGALTNFRTFPGKATLPEPWEVAAHVRYALKTKSLNCLGANVRDGFFNRIRRIN